MEENVQSLTYVAVKKDGMKQLVVNVNLQQQRDNSYSNCYGCLLALCEQECMNGGNCTSPNTCICTTHWEGHNCTTGQ